MKVKIEFTIDVTKEQRVAIAHAMTSDTDKVATRGDVRFIVAGLGMSQFAKVVEEYGADTSNLNLEPCNSYQGSCIDR